MTHPMLLQELRRIESRARSAAAKVSCVTELAAVVRLGELHVVPWAKPLINTLVGVRLLHQAVTCRLERLVQEQLKEVESLNPVDRINRLNYLQQQQWIVLRGAHAALLSRSLREAQRIRQTAAPEAAA